MSDSQKIITVGRRKEAIARVHLTAGGTGLVTVNGKPLEQYFTEKHLREAVLRPFTVSTLGKSLDVSVKVLGGGRSGQAQSVAHGIARALLAYDENLKPTLRRASLLTRDARVKERKKPGLRRARRAPQWSKR